MIFFRNKCNLNLYLISLFILVLYWLWVYWFLFFLNRQLFIMWLPINVCWKIFIYSTGRHLSNCYNAFKCCFSFLSFYIFQCQGILLLYISLVLKKGPMFAFVWLIVGNFHRGLHTYVKFWWRTWIDDPPSLPTNTENNVYYFYFLTLYIHV